MKNFNYKTTVIVALVLFSFLSFETYAQNSFPKAYSISLKQLEETWNVLDQVNAKVWPGWAKYSEVPFLFRYADGVEMLVGHPNPSADFKLVEGVSVRDKKVYLNKKEAMPLEMVLPVSGGGGPIPYGSNAGKPVLVVDLSMAGAKKDVVDKKESDGSSSKNKYESEEQILINLHELFHCYQRDVYRWRYGNLQYNTDSNFSTYAEIEGIALEKAYLEKDNNKAKEYMKDFVVARELKRKSMDKMESSQESEEEIMEGGAVHAEVRTCEVIKEKYQPGMTKSDDPYFENFVNVDTLITAKLKMLHGAREYTMDARNKSYSYGAFQALLLDRFTPGWQNNFYQNGVMFDQLIRDYVKLSDDEKKIIEKRIKTNYNYDALLAKHSKLINERDDAYKMIQARKGISIIVNFKNTFEYPFLPSKKQYILGLMHIFPEGFDKFKMEEIELTSTKSPILLDQLYHVKWIDTDSKNIKESYKLKYSRKEGDDIYYDAVFTTGGFELKAPKIQVLEQKERIKVLILSKIKV